MQSVFKSLPVEEREQLRAAMSYPEDSVGAQMDFEVISVRDDVSVEVVLRYEQLAESRDFAARGIQGALQGDMPGAWRHQHEMVARVRASYTDYLQRLGVRALHGAAHFLDPHTIAVGGAAPLVAGHVIIATGSSPFVPPGLPLCPDRILTTDDLFERPPPAGKRVAVIGSGVIGTEFAFILGMLGLEVVWLMQREPLSGSAYSVPARKALLEAFSACGIRPRTASRVAAASPGADGVVLTLPDGSREKVDWVLLGTGRVPHTTGLDLAAAGVDVDGDGFIKVGAYQQTSVPSIYAIGDVANAAMTSNHALAEAAVAIGNIITAQSRRRDDVAVPEVIYSALELARIGLNEDLAEARDIEFGAADALKKLAGAAYNHPTRAEEILNAVETLASRWKLGGHVFGLGTDAGRE